MRMKQIVPGLAIVLFFISCSKNDMRVTGKVTGCSGEKIYFDEVDVYLTRAVDSVRLKKNGNFRFRLSCITGDIWAPIFMAKTLSHRSPFLKKIPILGSPKSRTYYGKHEDQLHGPGVEKPHHCRRQ